MLLAKCQNRICFWKQKAHSPHLLPSVYNLLGYVGWHPQEHHALTRPNHLQSMKQLQSVDTTSVLFQVHKENTKNISVS